MGEFLLTIIKLVLALLLIPIVYACTLNLQAHFNFYPRVYGEMFLWGVIFCLISFLFIYQFWEVHEFGQKVVLNLFQFIAPLDRFVSYLLPFYLIITMLIFYVTKGILKVPSSFFANAGGYPKFLSSFPKDDFDATSEYGIGFLASRTK